MKPRVHLHLVSSADSASPIAHDPMLNAIESYQREIVRLDDPDLTDEEVSAIFKKALATLQGNPPPVARTREGAVQALRMMIAFDSLDPTDSALVWGALAFLESRGAA